MPNKIRKQTIGKEEFSFRMVNKTIRKIDEKYGNYGAVIYGLMEGEQFYTNALKLISCCCLEKDWELEELENIMTGAQYQRITGLAIDLYLDYMGYNEESVEEKEEDKKEKN